MLKKLNSINLGKSWVKSVIKNINFSYNTLEYTNQMYKAWLEDPNSVHESWQEYFLQNQGNQKCNLKF